MKQYKNTVEIRDNHHSCAKLKTYHFSNKKTWFQTYQGELITVAMLILYAALLFIMYGCDNLNAHPELIPAIAGMIVGAIYLAIRLSIRRIKLLAIKAKARKFLPTAEELKANNLDSFASLATYISDNFILSTVDPNKLYGFTTEETSRLKRLLVSLLCQENPAQEQITVHIGHYSEMELLDSYEQESYNETSIPHVYILKQPTQHTYFICVE